MNTTHAERRTGVDADTAHPAAHDISNAIRQGLILQGRTGTLSAVEHLKAHKVPGSVIGRVLSGGAMRIEDWMSAQ
jgi:hypothetical protein